MADLEREDQGSTIMAALRRGVRQRTCIGHIGLAIS
jgi:hypothetical protein